MMTREKKWYESRGAWGSIIAMLLGILQTMGVVSGAEGDLLDQHLGEAVTGASTAVAGAVGLYGRLRASATIVRGLF